MKVAFFSSRRFPAGAVLPSYNWAIRAREEGLHVVSGFASPLEVDVLHYLLKGEQPLTLVLARGQMVGWPREVAKHKEALDQALKEGRLKVEAPFPESVKRISVQTSLDRNRMILEIVDRVVVAYASKGGGLDALLKIVDKPVDFLYR